MSTVADIPEKKSKRAKTILLVGGKLLVSGFLLAYIMQKAGLRETLEHLNAMDVRYFLTAVAIQILIVVLASLRWMLLLGEPYPFGRLLSLCFIGTFFNNLLPSSVGGDSIKIYYLYKHTKSGGSSFGSVFLDRYIGLLALLTIGLVAGLIGFSDLSAVHMQWAIPLLFTAYIVGSVAVFGLRIGRRFSALSNFYEYFHQAIGRGGVLAKTFGLSLIIQSLTIGSIYLISRGLGQHTPLLGIFVFVPIIITLTTLPVSMAGFGVREGAFTLLFGMVGVPSQESVSISVLWFFSIACASLIGLVEYIRFKRAG